jgi:DNA invertase Pin-like site-specific DNA recombinase
LVADARKGRLDVVLAEALDRISRDQEHTRPGSGRRWNWRVRS